MATNLEGSDTSDTENIVGIPEEQNEFITLQNCQTSFTSDEIIPQKSIKHRRYSNWICQCNKTINKESIKRQLNRSKTTVEEHICYPWLRRLFFHLSNYFPNLHTTKPSKHYRYQSSIPSTSLNHCRQHSNVLLKKKINPYAYNSSKKNITDELNKLNSIQCNNNSMKIISMNDKYSLDRSYALEDSNIDITTTTTTTMNNSNNDNNTNNNINSNANIKIKRRPLQRQKQNGITDVDLELEVNHIERLTSSTSSEDIDQRQRHIKLTTPQTELFNLSSQYYQFKDNTIHSKPNERLYHNQLQKSYGHLSSSSSSSINRITTSQLNKLGVYNLPSSSSSAAIATAASTKTLTTGAKSHYNLQTLTNEQHINKSSISQLTDNTMRPINRRGYMTRSTNLIYDTLDESFDNYAINDKHKPVLSTSTLIYNDNNHDNNIVKYVNHRNIPESPYCIQFKRVKARRTSSSSQTDCNKTTTKNRLFNKDHSIHDNYQSKLYSSNQINRDNPNGTLIHSSFFCPSNDLLHDEEPVKKHLETWLKEAVTRTIQGKVLTRRNHMSHETQRELPEPITLQPHSFDGPISRYHDECLFTTGYSQQSIRKPFSVSLNTSTDSPQIKPPSITRDSVDGYLPYYYENVFEKQPEVIKNNNIHKTDDKLNVCLSDLNKLYRRHSDNPMSDVNNRNSKFNEKSTSNQYQRNFITTTITTNTTQTNSSSNSNQALNDYPDRLQIKQISRELANSFKESERINKDYIHEVNQSDVHNNKPILYNTTDNHIFPYYHINTMSRTNERLPNITSIKQRHSFNEKLKQSRLPIVTTLPEKYRLTHTLSDENRNRIISTTMNNASQSLRRLSNLKRSTHTSIDMNTGQHVNHELVRHGLKYSNLLDPSLSIDYNVLHQPNQSISSERRYSRHLKPLDAFQNRQSHSMEIVYSTPINQRSLPSPQKRSPLSKQTAVRKLPVIYSRSLQHSTCSFPVQWGGFLSGPTLSLTSPFDSSSLTPDSINHRQFFRSSLDSHEPKQSTSGLQQHQHFPPHKLYRDRVYISKDHAYSATESPKNITSLEEPINNSQNIKSLHHSRINLSPWPYNTQSIKRKVHSFELNPVTHYQQLSPDFIRNTSGLLKVSDNLPSAYSTPSSRRGSSNSNNSVFISKDWKTKLPNDISSVNNSMSNININYTNSTISQPSTSEQNCKTKPLEKLIPPDLIFSPASRRASMMDEEIQGIQNSMLNVTNDLPNFYLNHSENNNDNNHISTIQIDPFYQHHLHHEDINDLENTTNISNNNNQLNRLTPIHLYESTHSNVSSSSSPYEEFNLRYNRHKSADAYIPQNRLNNLQTFYAHRHSDSRQQNVEYLTQTYYKPNQSIITSSYSPLLMLNANDYRDNYPNLLDQSNIKVTSCSQTDIRDIQHEWNPMHQLIKHKPIDRRSSQIITNDSMGKSLVGIYNSEYNLTNHLKETLCLDKGNQGDYEEINCMNKIKHSTNKQIQSISDEEFIDTSLPKLQMKTMKGKDYLFKSTRTTDTNNIDPELLKPSLGPVIDSSEENTSDPYDDYNEIHDKMNIVKSNSPINNSTQSTICHENKGIHHNQVNMDSHAARRKSFLQKYWQQAIQHDDDDDDDDDNEDVHCNVNKSDNEFNENKINSHRYESTGGLNYNKSRYFDNDSTDDEIINNSTLLHANKSMNTRCKSSESGLNYFNSSIRNNNTKSLHTHEHHNKDYHHNRRKTRRKSRYH
ncbi:hypothetical protein MN116_000666 [Schistosoma mekongi]|uniref:Uncharacterized protein n=1 Tax=Schistosoma mekongi TaxID=38744 RepID=A0AAE1ZKK8_SCHME|nr:hypothetical protein MN116_000666 [Schistosoma mekongi]